MKFMDCFTLYSWIITLLLFFTYNCVADTWYNDQLVSYYANDSQRFNRTEAEASCRDRGGRLAMLKDRVTHQFVYNILPTKRAIHLQNTYHIALNRGTLQCSCNSVVSDSDCAVCRRSWRWDDGTEMTTERWMPGTPWGDAGRGCGAENSWMEYYTTFCNSAKGFICQYSCRPAGCHRSDCYFYQPGVYFCPCEPGYTAQHCDTEVDECDSQPCLNGAYCIDIINGFSCDCVPGYTGETCETDVNECSSDPCENGGTCHDLIDSYTCNCHVIYTGFNCKTEANACDSNPCQHGGNCTNLFVMYICACEENFCGDNCEYDLCGSHVDQENSSHTLKEAIIGVSVTLAVITVISVVASSFMIFFWRRSSQLVKTADHAKVADANIPSVNSTSELVVIYEKVQGIDDDYQNAYQVLPS